jgi:hypothetical protein
MSLKSFVTALGMGAGMAYFLDRGQGYERREQVRDRISGVREKTGDAIDSAFDELADRARSVFEEARLLVRGGEPEALETTSPGARLAVGVIGGMLLASGLRRPGFFGGCKAITGVYLLTRSLNSLPEPSQQPQEALAAPGESGASQTMSPTAAPSM